MEIDKDLYNEIKKYCVLNGIKPKEYVNDLLKKAFLRDRYGEKPNFMVLPLRPEPKVEKTPAKVTVIEAEETDRPVPEKKVEIQEEKKETIIEPKSKKRKLT